MIAHQGVTQAEALLNLITRQLDASMGMLTLHGPNGDPPRILTSLNMPGNLASSMAALLDRDLVAPGDLNGGEWRGQAKSPATVAHNGDGHARITFLYRIAPRRAIGLTACRAGYAGDESGFPERCSSEFEGWIEPILGLIWQAEYEHALRDGLTEAINRFGFGIVLLDADCSPWFANAQARRIFDAGEGVRRAGNAIAATDFDDAIRLQTAIRHKSVSGDSFQVLLLHRARARPLIAVVAALDHPPDPWSKPATALYLLDPDGDTRAVVNALCRAHGLTATEAVLAAHLVGGATVEDAANRMHIQTQTARAYLKQIFAKTSTHRQAELVRTMLAGIIPVFSSAQLPPAGSNDSPHLGRMHDPVWG